MASYLGLEIFPLKLYYPLEHSVELDNLIVPFGDGFEQRVTKNLKWSTYTVGVESPPRPDGLGLTGLPGYRGINKFGINIRNMEHANLTTRSDTNIKTATHFWRFYQDMDGNQKSFWLYNPTEAFTADDIAGSNPKGRYLVRFLEPGLSRTLFVRHLYNTNITITEVRES